MLVIKYLGFQKKQRIAIFWEDSEHNEKNIIGSRDYFIVMSDGDKILHLNAI